MSIKDQRLCNYFHVEGVKDGVKYEYVCLLKIIMISDVSNINSITALRCTSSISDISNMLKAWLKSPKSQLSKTFFGLKIC